MRQYAIAAAILLLAVCTADAERPGLPSFCRGKDCPHFEVLRKTDDYELRKYAKTTWVGFNTTGLKYELAMGRAFAGLARYFNGANDQEVKMDLTTPYITKMTLAEEEGYDVTGNFTIALMVPEQYQVDAPRPTLETQHVFVTEEHAVYVRSVTGFATEGTFKEEHNKLRDALKIDGAPFYDAFFFAAVYDPPQRLTDRYNEVHIVAKEVTVA